MLAISDEVQQALARDAAVVALESTIIAHGLSWPANLETARAMEQAVRGAQAVPATVAVLDGQVKVGLTAAEQERLARDDSIAKASSRDLPIVAAQGTSAATTVAATLFVAQRAGIRVMATGGIGGVHRGVDATGDTSADLIELARTPVIVVCSGAKSILDLPRTLEFLETHTIPVVGYQTDELPAFYSRTSGLKLEYQAGDPRAVADMYAACRSLNLPAGMIVANPPPVAQAIPFDDLTHMVDQALHEADRQRVRGKALTPFLLERIRVASDGRTLSCNQALAVSNARLGAAIAQELGNVRAITSRSTFTSPFNRVPSGPRVV